MDEGVGVPPSLPPVTEGEAEGEREVSLERVPEGEFVVK